MNKQVGLLSYLFQFEFTNIRVITLTYVAAFFIELYVIQTKTRIHLICRNQEDNANDHLMSVLFHGRTAKITV